MTDSARKMTKEDMLRLAHEHLDGVSDPQTIFLRYGKLLTDLLPKYEESSEEGKKYIDQLSELLSQILKQVADSLPDSPLSRDMKRKIASVDGKHVSASGLLESFSTKQTSEIQASIAGEKLIVSLTQRILDMLFDATANTLSGASSFAIVSLLFWLVDELLLACYLSRRAFMTQSYTHLRTVIEIQDRVELFRRHPEWADVWAGSDSKKIWNELRPTAVRKKLGKPKNDPLYEFLSEQGSHPTFSGVQSRIRKSINPETGNLSLGIAVGGIRNEPAQMLCTAYCLALCLLSMMKTAFALELFLNVQEVFQIFTLSVNEFGDYLQLHFKPWAIKENFDLKHFDEIINQCFDFASTMQNQNTVSL